MPKPRLNFRNKPQKRILLTCSFALLTFACKNEKIKGTSSLSPKQDPLDSVFLLSKTCKVLPSTLNHSSKDSPNHFSNGTLEQHCDLVAGSQIRVRQAHIIGGFFRLTFAEKPVGCPLSEGFIEVGCGSIILGPLSYVAPTYAAGPKNITTAGPTEKPSNKLTPEKAFLNLIAFAEGTKGRGNDGYNIIYSGKFFTSYKDHPRKRICANYCSDAAGRYQFLSTTWDGVRRNNGLGNFEPANQDVGGLYLVRNRGVTTHTARLNYTSFREAVLKLGKEWASFPGSPYGQPVKSMSEMWKFYDSQF